MTNVTIGQILAEDNIALAMEHLNGKSDAGGSDGVRLSELPEYWLLNGGRIRSDIEGGSFTPGIAVKRELVAPNGKRRNVVLLNAVDRLLIRALYQALAPVMETMFSDFSFAYRPQRSVTDAVNLAISYMESGKEWVAEIDISHFFDSIPIDRLQKMLSELFEDKTVVGLISAFLYMRVDDDGEVTVPERGILQGSPLSPLLANFYLNGFDHSLETMCTSFVRYGDDINLYEATYEEALALRKKAKELLERNDLTVHTGKGGVFLGKRRRMLGYEFTEKNHKLYASRASGRKRQIYHRWQRTSIQYINRQYHLINDGVLTKRDFTLLFENEQGKMYLPAEAVNGVNIYANVTMTGEFLSYANRIGLQISFIDRGGEKIGSFIPYSLRKPHRAEAEQILLLRNTPERLKLAKKLQNANLFNLRAVLRYYERRGSSELISDTIKFITESMTKINEAKEINQLMICEAQARQKYYRCFNVILAESGFEFQTRSRRPPKDPLNAMLSFGNTMLYQFFSYELHRSELDIRFGILHYAARRAESLNLDLADLFKPIIVDRTIFTLVNRKMLHPFADFMEVEHGGVYLSEKGKRKFIGEFEQKLRQKVKYGKTQKTYTDLLKAEVKKLERFFKHGENYKPYKYVN